MSTITNVLISSRWAGVLLLLFLSGCVTLTDPIEEPAVLLASPTVTPTEFILAPTATPQPKRAAPFEAQPGEEAFAARATASPTAGPSGTPLPTATATPAPIVYTVVAGDTLNVIAIKHALTIEALKLANNLTDADTLSIGQQLIIPSAEQIVQAEAANGTPIPTPHTESGHLLHYVQVGDTLSGIAAAYDADRQDILLANGFRPDVQLVAGDAVIVPQGEFVAVPTATLPPPTTVPTIAIAMAPSSTVTTAPSATASATAASNVYTVKAGDYARVVASNHGITLEALKAANPSVNMETLGVGQALVIPAPGGAESATATVTVEGIALRPTSTPTPPAPIMTTRVVQADETLASIAQEYALSEEALKAQNPALAGEPSVGSVLQIPLGTPTPSPSPTPAPTITPTQAPKYLAPIPLLPADGSTWVHWPDKVPLQLVWTATGLLAENEFYVVRLRAVAEDGTVLWTHIHWTQNPSWRLEREVTDAVTDEDLLRWDVMVMRRTSEAGAAQQTGESLSDRSATFTVTFMRSE